MMDKHTSEVAVLLLGGCITGITYERWIELAAIDAVGQKPRWKGTERLDLLFSMLLLTSVFATAWLVLFMMRTGNKIFGQIAFALHILVDIFWLSCLVVFAVGELWIIYSLVQAWLNSAF